MRFRRRGCCVRRWARTFFVSVPPCFPLGRHLSFLPPPFSPHVLHEMSTLDKNDASNPLDEDASGGQAISVPDSGDTGESGKLKMIISLIKKCLGVKDIASMYVAGLVYSVRPPRRPLLSHQAFVTSCIPTGTDPEPGVLALLGQTRPLRCVSAARLCALAYRPHVLRAGSMTPMILSNVCWPYSASPSPRTSSSSCVPLVPYILAAAHALNRGERL